LLTIIADLKVNYIQFHILHVHDVN
jgi:hypothetical protein